jgi:hypothetical protein
VGGENCYITTYAAGRQSSVFRTDQGCDLKAVNYLLSYESTHLVPRSPMSHSAVLKTTSEMVALPATQPWC